MGGVCQEGPELQKSQGGDGAGQEQLEEPDWEEMSDPCLGNPIPSGYFQSREYGIDSRQSRDPGIKLYL